MKNVLLILTMLLAGVQYGTAKSPEATETYYNSYRSGNSFIFIEDGVTFSVYPDGEFDFYIEDQVAVSAGVRVRGAAFTFNSGYDYDPFVQYDDYGAIIQVENTPIYYDSYGRVDQIGNVDIRYRNGRVRRVGNLRVFYNRGGYYSHHTGYVNIYNRVYVYRPFHRYFMRPAVGFCMVYNNPYRQFYYPVRYTYYRPYHYNPRWTYARVGEYYRYSPHRERATYYRNDRRVRERSHTYYRKARPNYRSSNDRRDGIARTMDRREVRTVDRSKVRSNANVRRNKDANAGRSANRVARKGNIQKRGNTSRTDGVRSRSSQRVSKGDKAIRQRSTTPRSTAGTRGGNATKSKRSYESQKRSSAVRSGNKQRSTAVRESRGTYNKPRTQANKSRSKASTVKRQSTARTANKAQVKRSNRASGISRTNKSRSASTSRGTISKSRSSGQVKSRRAPQTQRSQARSSNRSRSNLRSM